MPPLKTPESLFNLCVEFISEWFSMELYAEQGAEHSVSAIKVLPSVTFNAVVEGIIKRVGSSSPSKTSYNDSNVSSMFKYLLTERLTYLDRTPLKPHELSLYVNFNRSLMAAFPTLKNLVYLSLEKCHSNQFINTPCDRHVLYYIGRYCNSLKYLNMSLNRVTDETLSNLIPSDRHGGCPLLENLILKGCSATLKSCLVDMLKHLPNIKNIQHKNLYEVVRELYRDSDSKSSFVELKLEYMFMNVSEHESIGCLCKSCADNDNVACIGTLCPEVKRLDFVLKDKHARNLVFFSKVSDLRICYESTEVSFSPGDESRKYFLQCGYKLQKLYISCLEFHTNFLKFLSETCHNLRELSIECSILVHDLSFDDNKENTHKAFPLLTKFFFEVSEIVGTSEEVLSHALHFILKSTHNLTCLKLKLLGVEFTDENFKHLWNSIGTKSLVDLYIFFEMPIGIIQRLTMSTVNLVLDKCPQLMNLGCLFSWNISKREIASLRSSIRKSNYDVKILGRNAWERPPWHERI